jgi:hypothetical protein
VEVRLLASLIFVLAISFLGACVADEPRECLDSAGCATAERCIEGSCEPTIRGDAGMVGDTATSDSSADDGGGSDGGGSDGGDPCVPADCDDSNACTDDRCTVDGCENTNSTAACDDGVFCNGADSCAAGACSVHGGDPCGTLTCNEATSSCDGVCMGAMGCPSAVIGAWSSCEGFADTCDEGGTRSRDVADFSCVSGACEATITTETEPCTRATDGTVCDDGDPCTRIDRCTGGYCQAALDCPPPCICDPSSGACRDSSGWGRCVKKF